MPSSRPLPPARDKLLFTPGPLTTSQTVKQMMLRDAGSWHFEFNAVVKAIRDRLLTIAGLTPSDGFEVILMQGTGTFGVEATLGSTIPESGKALVLINGAYGERILQMCQYLKIECTVLRTRESVVPNPAEVKAALDADPALTHVLLVHCETTTGILNPLHEIGPVVKAAGRLLIVDAMSSFGAIPINFAAAGIDYLISSANKCLEGVPGFSFVIARRSALFAAEAAARSLSLDLLAQLRGFENNGQFRYTPPTHAILAFEQALTEFENEGGVSGRGRRYQRNHEVLLEGMKNLGFRPYLDPRLQSYIITSFYYPTDPKFDFNTFYRRLSDRGFIIYPGKISHAALFRIGSVGRIFEADIRDLLGAIRDTVRELDLELEVPAETVGV